MTPFLYFLLLYSLTPSSLLDYPHCHNVSCSWSHIYSLLLQQKYPMQLPCFQANPFQYEAVRVGFLRCLSLIQNHQQSAQTLCCWTKLLAALETQELYWKDWCWSSNTLAPNVKSQLIGKDPDAGKDWGQEEKGATEDEMVGWHHRLSGHEFEQTPGHGKGQGSLVCCGPQGHKESDMTKWLNKKRNPKLPWCHCAVPPTWNALAACLENSCWRFSAQGSWVILLGKIHHLPSSPAWVCSSFTLS